MKNYFGYLLIAAISGLIQSFGSYSNAINRESKWFIPIFSLICISSNVAWIHFVAHAKDNSERFIIAQWWDLIAITSWSLIPALVYGVGLGGYKFWVGLFFVTLGSVLISLSK